MSSKLVRLIGKFWYNASMRIFPSPRIWALYSLFVRVVSSFHSEYRKLDPEFSECGLKQGVLPKNDLESFLQSLEGAETKAFIQEDFMPGYLSNQGIRQYERDLNKDHIWLALGSEQLSRLFPLLQALKTPVARCIGSPWRVVNVRCWKTRPGASEAAAHAWHMDGFPLKVLKIMIYPFGANVERGTTEIILPDGSTTVEGPPGFWILFKNSELLHRGIAPKSADRLIIEIT